VDFGDILEQWEREQKRKPENPKKRENRKGKAPSKSVHPLSVWLETHGVYDKDSEEQEPPSRRRLDKKRLLARRPDAVIDLHGLTRDQAWNALERFFEEGRRRGFVKLSIIHGKGNHSPGEAVLKRTVKEFIERCPFAGTSGQGPTGGTGATWVLLK
jgi:DNA-nicking Smr family endonuclease